MVKGLVSRKVNMRGNRRVLDADNLAVVGGRYRTYWGS